jgi:hypothetical protein
MVVIEDKNGNPYLVNQEKIRFAHIEKYQSVRDGKRHLYLCVDIKFIDQRANEPGVSIEARNMEDAKSIIEQLSGNLVVINRNNFDDGETPVMKMKRENLDLYPDKYGDRS